MPFDRFRSSQKASPDPADAARDVIRQLMAHRVGAASPSEPPPSAILNHGAYQAAIQRVIQQLPEQAARVEASFFAARKELDMLLSTNRRDRAELVARTAGGFSSPILVDLLIQHAKRLLTCDLDEALDLASWAREVAQRQLNSLPPTDVVWTAIARSSAHLANALRLRGNLVEAEPMLDRALELFDRRGTGDLLVEAEILELTAMLRISQSRLAESEALISMACSLYEECEAFERIGPALAEKAATLASIGALPDAIDSLEEALAQLELEHDPEVCAWAIQNQCFYLLQAKLPIDASEVLEAVEGTAEVQAKPWLEARQAWLRLELARQTGRVGELAAKRLALELATARLHPAPGSATHLAETPDKLGLGSPWDGGELPCVRDTPSDKSPPFRSLRRFPR